MPSSCMDPNPLHWAWTECQMTCKDGPDEAKTTSTTAKSLGVRFSRWFSFAAAVISRHYSPVRICTCGAFRLRIRLVSIRPGASVPPDSRKLWGAEHWPSRWREILEFRGQRVMNQTNCLKQLLGRRGSRFRLREVEFCEKATKLRRRSRVVSDPIRGTAVQTLM